mmetsp:Transcript_59846/g.106398  ORF Transcript_59846/g.106398 Transcript_59846/m.106398 type:complete len:640 (+) Transcript_59846:110-2029(+)
MRPAEALLCLLLAWILCANAVESQQRLHLDSNGRLSAARASQSASSEAVPWRTHQPLFPVNVNLDVSEVKASEGLTIVFDKGQQALRVQQGAVLNGGVAWGTYQDNIETTGWSELSVQTSDDQNMANDVKMYAAGFIEGLMTSVRISEFYSNSQKVLLKKNEVANALPSIRKLFKNQLGFTRSMTNMEHHVFSDEPEDPYYKHVRYTLFQMWGVLDGYNFAALRFGGDTLELEDMLFMNAGAELPQLMQAYGPDAREHRASKSQAPSFLQRKLKQNTQLKEDPLDDLHWERRVAESGRCSALVRLSDGNADIYMGHSTWDDYSKMTRIYKNYNFSLPAAATSASKMSFSSYPGVVSSTDDFYVMDSGLTVMETSLEILDAAAWDKVLDFPRFSSIPNFLHLMAVNRMASSSPHWARLMSKTNTGTLTAQWMVVDYNQFQSGKPLVDGTFWLVEMIPGVSEMQDMTKHLQEKRYWPSFNRPFFGKVRELSGHSAAERSHGTLYSWEANPRAQIFAANAGTVNAISEMRNLMDRNAYPASGVAPNDPGHDVAARMDLSPMLKIPNGGIDAKVTSRCLMKSLQVQAISGPSHQSLEPFRWKGDDGSELWADFPHAGLPDRWNFDYVQMTGYGEAALMDDTDC